MNRSIFLFITRNQVRIARASTIIIFLALIRTLIEPLRQQVPAIQLQNLLFASLLAAVSCLIMTIQYFYGKYQFVIATAILTLLVLILIKTFYMV